MSDLTTKSPAPTASASGLERFAVNGGVLALCLIAVTIVTAAIEPRFMTRLNIINVLRNFAFLALPSLAQMLVMITGGFDLSVGAVMAISSVLTAMTMLALTPLMPGMDVAIVLVAMIAACGFGAAVGLVNGLLVALFNLSAFMVTLAVTSALMGIILYFTQGIPVYGVLDSFISAVGRGNMFGVPTVTAIALAIAVCMVVMQRKSALGRHFYAVGSDARAARLSGVKVKHTIVGAYVLAGVLSAFCGFLMTSRLGSGQATFGDTLALQTIAAAVIGGVSLRGGVGRAEIVVLASLFLSVLANAMNILQFNSKYQTLMLGVVLIGALASERLLSRRN